jgi:hypothetical protein
VGATYLLHVAEHGCLPALGVSIQFIKYAVLGCLELDLVGLGLLLLGLLEGLFLGQFFLFFLDFALSFTSFAVLAL